MVQMKDVRVVKGITIVYHLLFNRIPKMRSIQNNQAIHSEGTQMQTIDYTRVFDMTYKRSKNVVCFEHTAVTYKLPNKTL